MTQSTSSGDNSSNANANDSSAPTFEPTIVDSEAEIAELLRDGPNAGYIKRILDESEATLICLQSTWHGNQFLGEWLQYAFVHIDFTTEKAIHIKEGIDSPSALKPLQQIERRSQPSEQRRAQYEQRAFRDWAHGDHYIQDEFCPKSAITTAVKTPNRSDHLVVTYDEQRTGALDEGELCIRTTGIDEWKGRHGYQREEKFIVEGKTYEAFKECRLSDALPFMDVTDASGDIVEHGCFHSYDGDNQLIAMSGLPTFIDYATEAGFTVSVHSEYAEYVDADPSGE